MVEIQGLAGISVTEDRSKGFADQLKKKCPDGGLKIVAKQPGDFNPDTGLKVMENILQAEKQIDAVYTHDDDMAQGVVQAIRNAGREDEMFLTGVGGSEDAMKQIKAGGLYRATFLYNPNMAASAVNMARLIALGEGFPELVPPEVPRQVIVPGGRRHQGQRRRVRAVRLQLGRAPSPGNDEPAGRQRPAGSVVVTACLRERDVSSLTTGGVISTAARPLAARRNPRVQAEARAA